MPDITDLRGTIVPKSDQLNAEQLLGGDMTITVTDVRIGNDEQPVIIHYEHDNGRPFKPSKTVRKILIFAWGEDGRNWIGKSMTLFNDQSVRFGGQTVGGIRVSHLSDIEREIAISLTATKGKKAQHTIQVLQVPKAATLGDVLAAIAGANDADGMARAQALALKLVAPADIEQARKAYGARMRELKAAATPAFDPAPILQQIAAADSVDALDLVADAFRDAPGEHYDALKKAYDNRRAALEPAA
jgi:hypothetical protein